MKDRTETPPTERKLARRGQMAVPVTVGTETSAPAIADLQAELANLRQLIRRQDAVVERLLSERAASDGGRVTVREGSRAATKAKRSTRRGLLTQLAAGAAGVAAAAVYGSTKAGTANAEFFGTVVGASTAQWGIYAYPNGVTQFPAAPYPPAGVYGQADNGAPQAAASAGVIGISANQIGVLGRSNNNYGVYGQSDGSYGVNGQSNTWIGVLGGSGTNYGVNGTSNFSFGVRGSSAQYHGVGGFAATAGFAGVYGESSHSSGLGVWGYNISGGPGVAGTGSSGPGVRGISTSGAGVLGVSDTQPGVDGTSTNSLGIRGTSTNFVGIVGISTNSHGLYGSSNGGAAVYGIVAENNGANGRGLLVTGSAPSQIYGGLQVFGAKNAVLKMQDGTFASVYCQESPEPYFEDFGKAQLTGGVASVTLEREFASLVAGGGWRVAGGEYMVFCFPEGDTRGLYVSRKGPAGFEVREVQGGTGNVPFTYRIVTRRKDIEGKRFVRVDTSAAEKVAGVRAALAAMGAPAAGPTAPTQPVVPPTNTSTPPPIVTGGPGATITPPGAGPSSARP